MNFFKHHWNRRDKLFARWGLIHFAFAVGIGIGLAAAILLWQTKSDSSRVADLRSTAEQVQDNAQTPPKTGKIGGPFYLINQDGKPVSDADFRGKYMLIYFGYTYCPDMCPTGLQSMAKTLDDLGPDAGKVAALFITIDPARDTAEKLKSYVAEFHPNIQGLTGSAQQVAEAASAYQVYYAKGEMVDDHDYVMDHSSLIYVMAPDGSFITTFPEDANDKDILQALRKQMGGAK